MNKIYDFSQIERIRKQFFPLIMRYVLFALCCIVAIAVACAMIENNVINDTELLRKCLVFYNAIGGDYDIQELDYKNVERLDYRKYKTQLKPVISKDDKFDIEKAKEIVIAYVKDLLVLTDGEKEFLNKLKDKTYAPELLFANEEIVANIKNHPAALWRTKENN